LHCRPFGEPSAQLYLSFVQYASPLQTSAAVTTAEERLLLPLQQCHCCSCWHHCCCWHCCCRLPLLQNPADQLGGLALSVVTGQLAALLVSLPGCVWLLQGQSTAGFASLLPQLLLLHQLQGCRQQKQLQPHPQLLPLLPASDALLHALFQLVALLTAVATLAHREQPLG
jgi:hypothetical protein